MTKKLRTIIIISSVFLVVVIFGLLAASILTDVSSTDVYDFRVLECPKNMAFNVTDKVNYDFYLGENTDDLVGFFNDKDAHGARVVYKFVIADDDVVEIVDDDAYYLHLKKVGQTEIEIYKPSLYEDVYVETVLVNVYKELAVLDVYLSTSSQNRVPFIISQNTSSGNSVAVAFKSTDERVAKAVEANGRYCIEYYREGTTTITVCSKDNDEVKDEIFVNVYNREPNSLIYVDENGNEINEKVIYTDGTQYEIDYQLIYGSIDSGAIVNGNNVRIANFSTTPILLDTPGTNIGTPFDPQDYQTGAGVVLDKDNSCIKVKKTMDNANKNDIRDCLAFITLQTFYQDGSGNEIVTGNYTISVIVLRHVAVDMEIEISSRPEFDDTHKNIINYTGLTWKGVEVAPWDCVYFTKSEEVRTIYFRLWVVWNNGDRVLYNVNDTVTVNFTETSHLSSKVSGQDFYSFKSTISPENALIYEGVGESRTRAIYNVCTINVGSMIGGESTIYFNYKFINPKRGEGDPARSLENSRLEEDKIIAATDLYEYANNTYRFYYFDTRLSSKSLVTNHRGEIIGFN